MCFSAEASFSAGVVLTIVGAAALKKVSSREQVAFAAIPLVFGIQQISEGCVWLSLSHSAFASWQIFSTYFFLAIAQIIWPLWVPISIYLYEKDNVHKKALSILIVPGMLISAYLVWCMLTHQIHSSIDHNHIFYSLDFPGYAVRYGGILYFIATVVPPFFSKNKKMWVLGLTILGSYIFTKIFFTEYVISVWCFLAAVISMLVYSIVSHPRAIGKEVVS